MPPSVVLLSLDLSEITVDYIIFRCGTCISCTCTCRTAHIRARAACSLSLLINLGEQGLCTLHEFFLSRLHICNLGFCHFLILGLIQQCLQSS